MKLTAGAPVRASLQTCAGLATPCAVFLLSCDYFYCLCPSFFFICECVSSSVGGSSALSPATSPALPRLSRRHRANGNSALSLGLQRFLAAEHTVKGEGIFFLVGVCVDGPAYCIDCLVYLLCSVFGGAVKAECTEVRGDSGVRAQN